MWDSLLFLLALFYVLPDRSRYFVVQFVHCQFRKAMINCRVECFYFI
ncbi:hypothetical protein HMPREF9347_04924 [Escherichia coli MS 124-1]|nr:hypothetical protein HMPREF9536_02283 [Escherichia coli MS 84-1]EFK66186.1 hypothetical protein HMPREF9347_04924 [Escherichia coli MS 124-1]